MSFAAIWLWFKTSWVGRALLGTAAIIVVLGVVFLRGREAGKEVVKRRQEKQLMDDVKRKERDREELDGRTHDSNLDEL